MIRSHAVRGAAAIAAAVLGVAVLLVPSSASAGVVTGIQFETSGPVSVDFGAQWQLTLSVTSSYEEGPTLRLLPADGTVDVYFSGIGGAFASGLAIQPDGLVYVSQPDSAPLLPAGEYEVSAIYNPAAGGYYDTSQTATPLKFTVTALAVAPAVQVVNDAAVSERPVITASLSGSYIEKTGGAPAGTWHFIVTDADGQPVFDENVAQSEGSTEPVRIEIDSKLTKGDSYTVTSSFTDDVDCDTTTVTRTTTTVTTGTVLNTAGDAWIPTAPVSVLTSEVRPATAVECPVPVTTPVDPPTVPTDTPVVPTATGANGELVTTGVDLEGGLIAAGLLLAAGIALLVVRARRRVTA